MLAGFPAKNFQPLPRLLNRYTITRMISAIISIYVILMCKKNQPDLPTLNNGLFRIIRMEESMRLKWVKPNCTL